MGKNSREDRSRSPSPNRAADKKDHKKHKKHSKHKHKSRDNSEERLLREAKAFLKKRLEQDGGKGASGAATSSRHVSDPSTSRPVKPYTGSFPLLSEDDYFQRNAELSTWLRDSKQIFFSDLDSETAHAFFRDFVREWNSGALPSKFYTGIAAAATQRTGYTWGFSGAGTAAADRTSVGLTAAIADDMNLEASAREAAAGDRREAARRSAAAEREWIDAVHPKAEGREARVEARVARREEKRAREDSPEHLRLPGGGDVLGGGDSFQAAKARLAASQGKRAQNAVLKHEALQHRLVAAQAAEDAKMAQFRALLGASGGAIQIPKRL
ncbi:hypothetical protein ACKKBF_B19520 [Auxenochlorella protothecoides x Auxenochlorella symbiontica]